MFHSKGRYDMHAKIFRKRLQTKYIPNLYQIGISNLQGNQQADVKIGNTDFPKVMPPTLILWIRFISQFHISTPCVTTPFVHYFKIIRTRKRCTHPPPARDSTLRGRNRRPTPHGRVPSQLFPPIQWNCQNTKIIAELCM